MKLVLSTVSGCRFQKQADGKYRVVVSDYKKILPEFLKFYTNARVVVKQGARYETMRDRNALWRKLGIEDSRTV